jgi:chromosomal replication initiator protein
MKIPPGGGFARRSIAAARPRVYPQPTSSEQCGKGQFPPRLSTAVEGGCDSAKHLLTAPFCSKKAGWYARRSRVHEAEGPVTGVEHQIELTAESLWSEVAGRLRGALNDTTYGTWFGEAHGLELNDHFVLAVPNDFTRDWIEGHFLGLIGAAIRDVTGEERPIELRVSELRLPAALPLADDGLGEPVQEPIVHIPPSRPESGGFNAKYTFDSFVIGSSNRFAHAAALAVAEAPAQAYNPLFIYGSTGLGKTHLLQAVAQYVSEHTGELSVRYITSETFMNDFINSLRDKRIEGFKQRYRTYDVLLIDDVQFFEHKERIQEEFFHTFNSLYEAGSQIVMSSDRPPRDIATLEARLRSRFEWGLITDIQPPDLETRIAILRKKVKTDGIHVPETEVLTFIASRVSTNIRELEGALTRVVAFSSLTGRPMSVELAQDVLKDVFPQGEAAEVSIKRIQDLVAERFGLSLDELCGDKRSQNIVYPRQVAMYLSRELTDSSLPKIGKEFGGRDHTTVIHATSKIARLIREDRSVWNLVQELTARVKQVR